MNKFLYWFVTVPARNLALIAGGVIVVLLVGIFAVVGVAGNHGSSFPQTVSGSTPLPIVPTPTEFTAQALATIQAASSPTPGTAPGFGGTVEMNGWTISLARMEVRACVSYKATDGTVTATDQQHYLIWVDAKNNATEARSLRNTIGWAVRTAGDHNYYALPDQDPDTDQTGTWVEQEGRDYLSATVQPGQLTHPLLAFRTFNFQPLQLLVSSVEDVPKLVIFDLAAGINPTPAATPGACQ